MYNGTMVQSNSSEKYYNSVYAFLKMLKKKKRCYIDIGISVIVRSYLPPVSLTNLPHSSWKV